MPAPTRQNVLDFGLPAPAAARPPELVEQAVIGSGLIFRRAHGLALDAPVSLRAISSTTLGAPPSSLPGGLAEGVTYYVRPATSDSFQIATAVSPAAPIASFSNAGTGRFSFVVDPGTQLDIAITRAWDLVQSDCTAHGGDVDAPILTDAAAALAARLYVAILCAGDPAKQQSYDGIASLYAEVYAPKLAAYFRGIEIRGATDSTPGTTENGAVALRARHQPFRAPYSPLPSSLLENIDDPFGGGLGPRRDRV